MNPEPGQGKSLTFGEDGPETVTPVREMIARLAADYDARPVEPERQSGAPGDLAFDPELADLRAQARPTSLATVEGFYGAGPSIAAVPEVEPPPISAEGIKREVTKRRYSPEQYAAKRRKAKMQKASKRRNHR